MPVLRVLTTDTINEIEAEVLDGRALTGRENLETALGWEWKPEGLCRGDVCVPLADSDEIGDGDRVDLSAVASRLGMSTLLDEDAALLAVSAPAAARRAGLKGRVAPDFTLPDLDGNLHSLEQFKDRKRLLIAFASW